MFPVMLILDTAPKVEERMTSNSLHISEEFAKTSNVGFLYYSPEHTVNTLPQYLALHEHRS